MPRHPLWNINTTQFKTKVLEWSVLKCDKSCQTDVTISFQIIPSHLISTQLFQYKDLSQRVKVHECGEPTVNPKICCHFF